jgi:predicted O-methyltransferase YrrM
MSHDFPQLHWSADRLVLNGWTFRLEHTRSDDWDGGEHFRFFKLKGLVDQFIALFEARPDFRPKNILDLGTFDGGSAAFWYELFRPAKLISLDIRDGETTDYFRRYVESRGAEEKCKILWRIDQSDKRRLREIASTEFDGPIDLVIDDASHFYRPSRASFEALFPLVAPRGLYIIEDCAWGHWADFAPPDPAWSREVPLTRFVVELIEAVGTSRAMVEEVIVKQGLAAVERGVGDSSAAKEFDLDAIIYRRPRRATWLSRLSGGKR